MSGMEGCQPRDNYLNSLAEKSTPPVIILDSPVFETGRSAFENPNDSDGPSHKSIDLASPSVVSSVFENDGLKPLMLKQLECFSRPMNLGNYLGGPWKIW